MSQKGFSLILITVIATAIILFSCGVYYLSIKTLATPYSPLSKNITAVSPLPTPSITPNQNIKTYLTNNPPPLDIPISINSDTTLMQNPTLTKQISAGSLLIKVVDQSTDQPIPSAKVSLITKGSYVTIINNNWQYLLVDNAGQVTFNGLREGENYEVTARAKGFIHQSASFTYESSRAGNSILGLVKAPSKAIGRIEFSLGRSPACEGPQMGIMSRPGSQPPVTDNPNCPKNMTVEIFQGIQELTTIKTQQGIVFFDLPNGDYTAKVSIPGFSSYTMSFYIEAYAYHDLYILPDGTYHYPSGDGQL